MQKCITLIFILFLSSFIWVACDNDTDNNKNNGLVVKNASLICDSGYSVTGGKDVEEWNIFNLLS